MSEPVQTRKIKVITGNSTAAVRVEPSVTSRLHALSCNITCSVAAASAAALLAQITFRVKTGTTTRREVTGTELQDYCALNGAGHAWTVSTTNMTGILPFAEEWFIDSVANLLAWNPAIVGPISVEIVNSGAGTLTVVAYERVSDDLDAPSAGIITWERVAPASAIAMVTSKEIEPRGQLIQASIYNDTGGNAVTQAALMVGPKNFYVHEDVPVAENSDINERFGLLTGATAVTAGRSNANIYDMVFVRGDSLTNAIPMENGVKFDIRSAAAGGTRAIILARLEPK